MSSPSHPITLVAIDIDNTLLTSSGDLPAHGSKAVQGCRERGVRIVLATARNPQSVLPFCLQLGIHDPIICSNGAQTWGSPEGPVWWYHTIPREVAQSIAEIADRYGWSLKTTIKTTTYWRFGAGYSSTNANTILVSTNVEAITSDPVRIVVYEEEAILALQSFCQTQFSSKCHTELFYNRDGTLHSLAIFSPYADKGKALELVLNRLDIPAMQVMAIGDSLNDRALFSRAGFTVAMGNAVDELKQQAVVIAPDNDHEGVAWALETYVLNRGLNHRRN